MGAALAQRFLTLQHVSRGSSRTVRKEKVLKCHSLIHLHRALIEYRYCVTHTKVHEMCTFKSANWIYIIT